MLIASFLLATAVSLQAQTPDQQSVARFVEQLVASEVTLQLNRREVKASKASRNSVRALMNDAAGVRTLVQSFEDQFLAAQAEPLPPSVAHLKVTLYEFKKSLEATSLLPTTLKAGENPCCEHDTTYIKLVAALHRFPGFSPNSVSGPVRYNMTPVLYETKIGAIYADFQFPDEARISPRCARKGSKLRSGDTIVAIRRDDRDPWEAVKGWGDVLHASEEFGREQPIHIQVRRNNQVKSLSVLSTTVAVES